MTDATAIHGGDELAVAAKPPLGLVLLLGSLTALGPLSIDMYLPGLPAISASLGASAAAAQQTVAVFFVGMAVGQLAYGPLSDRFGRKAPVLLSLALYVIGSLGCATAPSIEVLLGFRIVQALGGCGGGVIARAIVSDLFPPREMLHVFSLLILVLGISPILAPLLGGWVLVTAGWRAIFVFQVVFGALLALATLLRLTESRSEETLAHARSEHPVASYLGLLRMRKMWAYLLAGALSGAALFTYIASSPDILIGRFGVAPQAFGWIFGVNGVGLIAATQVNAWLARRVPSAVLLRWSIIVALAFSLVLTATAVTGAGGLPGLLVPLFLIVSSLGFTQSNAFSLAMTLDSRRAGATAALGGSVSFGAGALSAALAAILRDGTARPMAIVITGAMALSLGALALLAPRAIAARVEHRPGPHR